MHTPTPHPRVLALHLTAKELDALRRFAPAIWWQTAEQTMERPDCLIAQVMNLGLHNETCDLEEIVGPKRLQYILEHAEPGEFGRSSWAYWHYRLLDTPFGCVPPLPQRSL